ncbi:chaperone NapD [Helicobacter mehlei]|nr:chaperone NapD [Helicobacter mehlei]
MNISSVIIKVDLEHFEDVLEALRLIPHVEVPILIKKGDCDRFD